MKNIMNNSLTEKVLVIIAIVLVSFYVIYTLSSSIFMVITGAIILLIGSFIKDPEKIDEKAKITKLEQLTLFSEEVLEPSIILAETKNSEVLAIEDKKIKKNNKQVLDIENTNSYKFDELDKKIKKSKKVKA